MELLIKEGEETRLRQVDLDHFGSLPAANLQASDTLLSAMSDSPPRGRRKRSRGSPQSSPEATRRRLENELAGDLTLPSWMRSEGSRDIRCGRKSRREIDVTCTERTDSEVITPATVGASPSST